MTRPKEKRILAGLALAFAVLIFVGLMLLGSANEQRKTAAWVAHTRDVLAKINELVTYLSDAENGRRGYVLSGQDRYLGHHTNRVGHVEVALRELRALTVDNPRHSAACERQLRCYAERVRFARNAFVQARIKVGGHVKATTGRQETTCHLLTGGSNSPCLRSVAPTKQ